MSTDDFLFSNDMALDPTPEEMEETIKGGMSQFMENGVSAEEAEKLARQVYTDISNLRRMVLEHPMFAQLLDVVETIGDFSIVDADRHVQLTFGEDRSVTLKNTEDLIWWVYTAGFMHGRYIHLRNITNRRFGKRGRRLRH